MKSAFLLSQATSSATPVVTPSIGMRQQVQTQCLLPSLGNGMRRVYQPVPGTRVALDDFTFHEEVCIPVPAEAPGLIGFSLCLTGWLNWGLESLGDDAYAVTTCSGDCESCVMDDSSGWMRPPAGQRIILVNILMEPDTLSDWGAGMDLEHPSNGAGPVLSNNRCRASSPLMQIGMQLANPPVQKSLRHAYQDLKARELVLMLLQFFSDAGLLHWHSSRWIRL